MKCTYCGAETSKKNECYKCRKTKRAFKNELASPEYCRDIAIDHVNAKPGVLKSIFGLI
jgi:hypothetical protein